MASKLSAIAKSIAANKKDAAKAAAEKKAREAKSIAANKKVVSKPAPKPVPVTKIKATAPKPAPKPVPVTKVKSSTPVKQASAPVSSAPVYDPWEVVGYKDEGMSPLYRWERDRQQNNSVGGDEAGGLIGGPSHVDISGTFGFHGPNSGPFGGPLSTSIQFTGIRGFGSDPDSGPTGSADVSGMPDGVPAGDESGVTQHKGGKVKNKLKGPEWRKLLAGEFVVNPKSAKKHESLLERINRDVTGRNKRFAPVSRSKSRLTNLSVEKIRRFFGINKDRAW